MPLDCCLNAQRPPICLPQAWKSGPGLIAILEVGRVCSPAFTTEVINVAEKLCRDSEELGVLLEFLLHAEFEASGGRSRTQTELFMFKEELVRLLYDVVRETPVMVCTIVYKF